MKKWISYIIDAILLMIIGVLGYVQISMLVSKDKNHGVPSAFNRSFLYVVSESMDDPDQPNGVKKGHGIIIEKVTNFESLKVSDPIYAEDDPNHENKPIDFLKNGAVVTFYYDLVKAPDTHRLINKEFNEETGLWEFETMGDNPVAHQQMKTERFTEKELIGKMVYHSKALGDFLTISSPAAAASAGRSAWFFPVAILTPVFGFAIYYIVDAILKYQKENKLREVKINEKLQESGIDLNDEEAVELFKMKEEMRLDYQEEYDKLKIKLRKELEKEKDKLRKENHEEK